MTTVFTELRNSRVKVTYGTDAITTTYGVLRGVTDEKIWIGELGIPRSQIINIEPAPLHCAECGQSVFRLFDGLCAACYRAEVAKQPPVQEPCQVCGAPGIRDPGTDEFLCTLHHAQAGNRLRISTGDADLLAECFNEDVSSEKHEWKRVRGARFRCIRCRRAEKYGEVGV